MKETGFENANRFVDELLIDSSTNLITRYEHNWPWMANEAWRNHVSNLICDHRLRFDFERFYFSAPDELDDWVFMAYKKHPKSITKLTLSDTYP